MKERSKTMKKKLALLLAGILTLGSFAGCGGDSGKKSTEEKSSVNADGELKVILLFGIPLHRDQDWKLFRKPQINL